MNNICKIYTLEHPITGEIRYVGRTTKSLIERKCDHVSEARCTKGSKRRILCWIKNLLDANLEPIIKELDLCYIYNMSDTESYWIHQLKSWGFDLVNHRLYDNSTIQSGNFIEMYGSKRAKEIKEIYSKSQKLSYSNGRKVWNKGIVGTNSHMYGRLKSKETINKTANSNKGRRNSIESIENIRKSKMKGRVLLEFNEFNEVIFKFNSITEFVDKYNLNRKSVTNALSAKKSIHNHIIKYSYE